MAVFQDITLLIQYFHSFPSLCQRNNSSKEDREVGLEGNLKDLKENKQRKRRPSGLSGFYFNCILSAVELDVLYLCPSINLAIL